MRPRVAVSATILAMVLPWVMAVAAPPPPLDPFTFLIGTWEASGEGQPGQGSGRTVFSRSVQDRVILRTNFAEYPASGEKPASRHDDLMVIYVAAASAVRADYYDSEGHVIRYSVRSPATGQAVFLSDIVAGEPRYRLTYKLGASGLLDGEFAVAPPGQLEAFKPYLAWQARRAKAANR